MTLSELIARLQDIKDKYGESEDFPVYVMTEITEPTRLQIEDSVSDVAYSGHGVIIIGQERLDNE